jgi:D-tyrosyl-tRNA(Tyr) deacylase
MRALVQRTRQAAVRVAGRTVGEIGRGLCVLVGVTHGDDETTAARLASKVAHLRLFPSPEQGESGGRSMERSLVEVGGSALVVSQFTLYGDASRGRRPSWALAARPEQAAPLVDAFARHLEALGVPVARGVFGADMEVELINCGPVTLLVEV